MCNQVAGVAKHMVSTLCVPCTDFTEQLLRQCHEAVSFLRLKAGGGRYLAGVRPGA
jgi:hypothetical protein